MHLASKQAERRRGSGISEEPFFLPWWVAAWLFLLLLERPCVILAGFCSGWITLCVEFVPTAQTVAVLVSSAPAAQGGLEAV